MAARSEGTRGRYYRRLGSRGSRVLGVLGVLGFWGFWEFWEFWEFCGFWSSGVLGSGFWVLEVLVLKFSFAASPGWWVCTAS
jgi:hypothetical protein